MPKVLRRLAEDHDDNVAPVLAEDGRQLPLHQPPRESVVLLW